jgi:hypothetical protein
LHGDGTAALLNRCTDRTGRARWPVRFPVCLPERLACACAGPGRFAFTPPRMYAFRAGAHRLPADASRA